MRVVKPTPEAFTSSITTLHFSLNRRVIGSLFLGKNFNPQQIADYFSPLWAEIARFPSLTHLSVGWDKDYGRNLGQYEWIFYRNVEQRVYRAIHAATGGGLTSLSLLYNQWASIPGAIGTALEFISSNQDLRELQLTNGCCGNSDCPTRRPSRYVPPIHALLGRALVKCPGLRRASVLSQCPFPVDLIGELFPSNDPQPAGYALEELYISGDFVGGHAPSESRESNPPDSPSDLCIDFHKLPALKSLQCLDISGCHSVWYLPPDSFINLDILWLNFQYHGTRLSELSLEYGISMALLNYLSNYRGLEKLNLKIYSPIDLPPSSDTFALSVLPAQEATLKELHLYCPQNFLQSGCESLALNLETWPSPSSFLELEHLNVYLPVGMELRGDTFKRVMLYADSLSKLSLLTLRCCAPLDGFYRDDIRFIISLSPTKSRSLKALRVVHGSDVMYWDRCGQHFGLQYGTYTPSTSTNSM
ncbi:hypothetical protein AX16_007622 [Volvariella volvacea WC 439]|nr:hypothetical protein AX16_007622 [Volvariella volvacea WC 439]